MRRTMTLDIDDVRIDGDRLVFEEYGDTKRRVYVPLKPWIAAYIASKCAEYLRLRRDEAKKQLKSIEQDAAS